MDTHVHLIIDVNGADISRIMHSINFSYAQYYNAVHKRHGHLFQDRFRSKMVKDERYLLSLSAYVHNNPTDLEGYGECPERYEFSSLAVYLGLRQDPHGLVDDGFIMSMFGSSPKAAREKYIRLVYLCNDEKIREDIEFLNEGTEYRSERKILVRNIKVKEIIEFIINKMGVSDLKIYSKHSRNVVEAKAILVFLMRSLCNYKCSEICRILGNVTQGRVSMLSSLGIAMLEDERYKDIVWEFLDFYAA
jgi:hypothetical protein